MKTFSDIFKKGLIVSCQASGEEPLAVPGFMARMALAAEMGGAVGIRANSASDIISIKKTVKIPVIGIYKHDYDGFDVRITPTIKDALTIIEAGSDVVAIDATIRPRPEGQDLGALIKEIRENYNVPVMADISTYEEGMKAAELGADAVATTLSGYTKYTEHDIKPNLELVRKLSQNLKVPVIAEGNYWTPEASAEALKAGAYGVVVGSAITRPHMVVKKFTDCMNKVL